MRSQTVQVATADGNEAVIADGLVPGMQVVSTGVQCADARAKVRILSKTGFRAIQSSAIMLQNGSSYARCVGCGGFCVGDPVSAP